MKAIPSRALRELRAENRKLRREKAELAGVLSGIIAYRDYEPWTHSTSAPSRQEEEHELWEKARKLVNKPRPERNYR